MQTLHKLILAKNLGKGEIQNSNKMSLEIEFRKQNCIKNVSVPSSFTWRTLEPTLVMILMLTAT